VALGCDRVLLRNYRATTLIGGYRAGRGPRKKTRRIPRGRGLSVGLSLPVYEALERHTGRRPGRTHDGVVIALRSNIRWCSDHFELACRNGEIVRVLFAIDACDREVMAWLATSAGISGEMVRDLMVACVERRFGISKAAHPVEWSSDNGSAYIAKDTHDTATALGLKLCFTPVRSPESNGIAQAFVKTFKRDYARLSILPDAETVIARCQLGSSTTMKFTRTQA
jgi:putative transposase